MGGGDTSKNNEKDEKNGKPAVPPTEYKFAVKPEVKTGWDAILTFLWNNETGEVMGRTGISWLKISVFYIVYYAFLAAFFMLMLLVFFQTLNDKEPRWTVEDSIIGGNPGIGYRPMPPMKNIESTLIWFRHGQYNGNYKPWVERLETHLKNYKDDSFQEGTIDQYTGIECGVNGTNNTNEEFCKIQKEEIFKDPCNNETSYGYRDGSPCILIKLNKIFGWTPQPYTNVTEMPHDIPEDIKTQFEQNIEDEKPHLNEKVWLSCKGENPADVENLGKVRYIPDNGYAKKYFPFKNQKQYLQPIVFAYLENPKKSVMIAIECTAWAKGLTHESMDRQGLVHFELMID